MCAQFGEEDAERVMMRRIGTFLALGLGALVGMAQTTSGEVEGNEVWSGEVTISGDVSIGFGSTLTIRPGTIVKVDSEDDSAKIELRLSGGKLIAEGTADAPIVFSASRNSGGRSEWNGIRCDLGEFVGRYINIQNATSALRYTSGGRYTFSDSEISKCGNGIGISAAGKYEISRVDISSFERYGVTAGGNCSLDLVDCNLQSDTNIRFGGGSLALLSWASTGKLFVKGCEFGPFGPNSSSNGIFVSPVSSTASVEIEDSTFTGIKGPGVFKGYTGNARISVKGSRFIRNTTGISASAHVTPASARYKLDLEISGCSFLANRTGVGLGDQRLSSGLLNLSVENSTFESNQDFGLFSRSGVNRVTGSSFTFNGVGLSLGAAVPTESIELNDFDFNSVHIENRTNSASTVVNAVNNFWGEETTRLLAEGVSIDSISSFRGRLEIDPWAESSVLVQVEPPPSPIEWENGDWGVTVGETATIRLTLENADSFDYQWFKDGVVLQGATGPSLEIRDASLADAGRYIVVVSNEAGSVTSEPALLSVTADPVNNPSAGGDSFHPADTNQDLRISIDEVTSYGAAWKNGRNWELGPNPIPIDYLTRAGAIWKNGERYRKDSNVASAPLWWVNASGAGRSRAETIGTTASSGFLRLSVRNASPRVIFNSSGDFGEQSVRVVPPAGTTSWALEGDGLREGPFWGDEEQVISLPTESSESPFLLSVDGQAWVVGRGDDADRPSLEVLISDGQVGLKVGQTGDVKRIQSSMDLETWSPAVIGHVDGGVLYPVLSSDHEVEFFRLNQSESLR